MNSDRKLNDNPKEGSSFGRNIGHNRLGKEIPRYFGGTNRLVNFVYS